MQASKARLNINKCFSKSGSPPPAIIEMKNCANAMQTKRAYNRLSPFMVAEEVFNKSTAAAIPVIRKKARKTTERGKILSLMKPQTPNG